MGWECEGGWRGETGEIKGRKGVLSHEGKGRRGAGARQENNKTMRWKVFVPAGKCSWQQGGGTLIPLKPNYSCKSR